MKTETAARLGTALFAVLLASYAINAMDRQLFPLLLTNVRKEYGFSLADAGLLSTVFTLGMAVAGIPTGYLLEPSDTSCVRHPERDSTRSPAA